jgi:hypothetical protein
MQINFNGRTYNSLEEMPLNERKAYEQLQKIFVDVNGNGIPDFLEGDVAQKVISAFTNTINYEGKVYNSLDELPADARQKVQAAFAKLNQMGILGPNAVVKEPSKSPTFDFAFKPSAPLIPTEAAISEEGKAKTSRLVLIIALAGVLVLGAAVAVILLFAVR